MGDVAERELVRRTAFALLVIASISSCRRSEPVRRDAVELETVEVGAGPNAELTTEHDPQARAVAIELAGVLPSDFPAGLPVFAPASIVDFGRLAGERGFVELDSPVPVAEVRSLLAAQVSRAGWTAQAIGDRGDTFSKEGRQVRVILTDLQSGTRIRYEY